MSEAKKPMTFMNACADFFGRKEGQTLMQFRDELKALNDKDRDEIKIGLEQMGYTITASVGINKAVEPAAA